MTGRLRVIVLRTSGILLCALGLLHLAVTPFIARLIMGAPLPSAVAWLTPPMLLLAAAAMKVGDIVLYRERRYGLRGIRR